MIRLSTLLQALGAAGFLLGAGSVALPSQAQSTPGYLWLVSYTANAVGTGGQVALSGQFTNDCNGLPSGSILQISFDQGVLLDVPIRATHGQSQQFSGQVFVPSVPPPNNHVTAYRFVILLPGNNQRAVGAAAVRPDMKTSPCLVTPALGTPPEP